VFRRRETRSLSRESSRYDHLTSTQLQEAIETSMATTAQLFRGLSHREIDSEWLLAQMESEITQVLAAIQALRRRVEK
jgi:hypothetical protein